MKARRLIVLLVIAAMASLSTSSTQLAARRSFAPIPQAITIPMLPGTAQPIDITQGNQTNPHLACNFKQLVDAAAQIKSDLGCQ